MATSLLSLAFNRSLDPTIAMTGELTVTGKVLRIGGLREKTVAARRAGAKKILFPADNMSDWLELPEVRTRTQANPLWKARYPNKINRISNKASKATPSTGTRMSSTLSSPTSTKKLQTMCGNHNSPNQPMQTNRARNTTMTISQGLLGILFVLLRPGNMA